MVSLLIHYIIISPLYIKFSILINSAFYQGHDSGGECNVPYVNRFGMPRPGADQPW